MLIFRFTSCVSITICYIQSTHRIISQFKTQTAWLCTCILPYNTSVPVCAACVANKLLTTLIHDEHSNGSRDQTFDESQHPKTYPARFSIFAPDVYTSKISGIHTGIKKKQILHIVATTIQHPFMPVTLNCTQKYKIFIAWYHRPLQ